MADVVIRGLDDILKIVVERGASDLHLQAGTPPMLRLHKHLLPIGTETLTGGGIEALVFPIMNDDQKAVFKQHMDFDFSYSVRGLARFRVNVFRQRGTMAVTMRRIPFNIPDLDSLGLPDSVKELTKLEKGFVLVTGPTGHGKSTTLAAIIDKINQERDVHTVTVEDPVEFLFQHRKGIVRVLTKSRANKDRRDVGANGEQIINELRHAFMIETRQRFKNVQPGGFPEVVHFCWLAVLDRQPAIARQSLKHFTQRGASDANQFREFAFSRKNGPRRETIIPDAFNDVLFRETRRALRLNDHSEISITQL